MAEHVDYVLPGAYNYKDILLYEAATIEHVKSLKNFKLYPDDIMIVGYPKSGNIWMQTILAAIQCEDLEQFKRDGPQCIRGPFDADIIAEFITNINRPNVILSHLRYSMLPDDVNRKNVKIVYVMRNPKDISVSYYHFVRMNDMMGGYRGNWNSFFKAFLQGKVAYGNCFDHVREWMAHNDDPNIYFIKYEDVIKNPGSTIKKLAEFVGKSLDDDTVEKIKEITSFTSMKGNEKLNLDADIFDKNESPFLRKGKVGDWVQYYDTEQNNIIDEEIKKLYNDTGLEFEYSQQIGF